MIRSVVWLLPTPNGYSDEFGVVEEIFENGSRMWGVLPLAWAVTVPVSLLNGYRAISPIPEVLEMSPHDGNGCSKLMDQIRNKVILHGVQGFKPRDIQIKLAV